jgi:toxin FitB
MIVLDTNVVSELMKPRPDERVVRWVDSHERSEFYTTSVTEAEILHGVRTLPAGKRRTTIATAAQAMFREDFARRVLPFDSDAARAYAEIVSDRSRAGRPITQFDAQIAAIVRATAAVLATRNLRDFERCGITVVDPWAPR